ncbi:hypothetical protein GCM10022246_38570 [Pedobacter ginsengiterrae]|uniref:Capsule assembly protein Wzi n=1 Tax=Pedobacter ginsengiterrae TaxID=871696 RepID=A0ABP7QIY6_9SPHI
MRKIFIVFSILFASCAFRLSAQTLPVGTAGLEDYYRRLQLIGKLDSSISFTQRPLTLSGVNDVFNPDSIDNNQKWTNVKPIYFAKGLGEFGLLPVTWQQQFNSHHPYGWNDGGMIPAKGYQTMLSAGFFAKFGPLSIQLRPEYVYAANDSFKSFGDGRSDADLIAYYGDYNYIDAPEGFGTAAYSKISWGQSSIRLTFGPVSFGLSNENLWWGPGMQNSIMMSNNAAGFKHLTLNTIRPIRTYIGSFEAQVIGGKLEGSKLSPLARTTSSTGADLFTDKGDDWRYLSALNISYQPKWVPGLFVGFTRSFLTYHNELNSFSDYFPLFLPYQKVNINTGLGETTNRDQRTSFYTRWLFQKAKAEVYFEYGLNDNSYNLRDFLGSPEHSRAYLLGLTKMVSLTRKDEFIRVNAEVTQLSQTVDYLTREAGSYYYHNPILEGYTNMGEVLGAGIGSGGNLQSLDVSWVKGLKQIGFTFDRYEHNMDFAKNAGFITLNGQSRRWVDLAFGAKGTWNYKNLLFNVKLQGIQSLNYQWVLKDFEPGKFYIPHNDVFNFHGELGVSYRF